MPRREMRCLTRWCRPVYVYADFTMFVYAAEPLFYAPRLFYYIRRFDCLFTLLLLICLLPRCRFVYATPRLFIYVLICLFTPPPPRLRCLRLGCLRLFVFALSSRRLFDVRCCCATVMIDASERDDVYHDIAFTYAIDADVVPMITVY